MQEIAEEMTRFLPARPSKFTCKAPAWAAGVRCECWKKIQKTTSIPIHLPPTLWQGVEVPVKRSSNVIITRLPSRPDIRS